MATRKAKLGKKIETDILKVLLESKNPVSTRELAEKIGRAWHSVQGHCLKLQLKGKVDGFRISNLNVWVKK
jgi:predicted transcriptional regulator